MASPKSTRWSVTSGTPERSLFPMVLHKYRNWSSAGNYWAYRPLYELFLPMKYVAIPHEIKGESKIKMIDSTLTLILSHRGRESGGGGIKLRTKMSHKYAKLFSR